MNKIIAQNKEKPAKSMRGTALLLVLWVLALMIVVLGGFVIIARTESIQTRYLFDTVRARYAAEAGISRAVIELSRQDPLARWIPDGRMYHLDFEDAKLSIAVWDESGKLDINRGNPALMMALLIAVGVDEVRAATLVDAIEDWKDPDDLVRENGAEASDYENTDLQYVPSNRPFSDLGELQQVLGMDYALYEKLEPYITIYAASDKPNLAYAAPLIVQTVTQVMPEVAAELVAQRQQMTPEQIASAALLLPDGSSLQAGQLSGQFTLCAKAELLNHSWTIIQTVIRLEPRPDGQAYTVLRWQEGLSDAATQIKLPTDAAQ